MPLTLETLETMNIAMYRQAAEHQWQKLAPKRQRRQKKALKVAHQASQILKKEFGATRVMLFGSLARPECFTPWSDIDLAIWGLAPQDTFKAIAMMLGFGADIPINLVDIHDCPPEFIANIEQTGVEL